VTTTRATGWSALVLLMLASSAVFAQEITLRVDRSRLDFDDELTLEMRIEGDIDEAVRPPTPGFAVTSQSSNFSMINGRTTQSKVYNFGLAPTSSGTFTIGPAKGYRGGRLVVTSNKVTVVVAEERSEPMSAEKVRDLEGHSGEPFFLTPVWPHRPVYVGEPFVLDMTLFVRKDTRVSVRGWKREPDLSDFSAVPLEIEQRRRPRQKKIGRYTYTVHPLNRFVVVPLEPGRLRVGASTLELSSGDFFDRRAYKAKAPPFEVEVRPLPSKGRPAEFRPGNVGRFEISAEVGSAEVKAGERFVLTVRVFGEGSPETVRAPVLPPMKGVETEPLEAGDADKIEKTADGVRGKRVFQWSLIPEQEGTLEIPALRFAYFDPVAAKYEVGVTEPVRVQVSGRAVMQDAVPGGAIEEAVTSELRDIRPESDLRSHTSAPLHTMPWYLWAIVVPGVLLVLFEFVHLLHRRRLQNAGRIRRRKAHSVAARQLRTARSLAADGNNADCFAEVASVLERFVSDRFGFSPRGLTHGALRQRLAALGADEALADDLVAELENCDFARFAPVSVRDDEMGASLERAADLITRLDRLGGKG